MSRTEVTVGGCCWAVETTIRRSLFYEVNAKILCFCGQRSHPQVFTGRSLQQLPGAPAFSHPLNNIGCPRPLRLPPHQANIAPVGDPGQASAACVSLWPGAKGGR